MDDHSLIKMAHIFNRIGLAIINGKSMLVEAMRELSLLNMPSKGRTRYLEEGLPYGVIPLTSPWWGPRPPMIMFSS